MLQPFRGDPPKMMERYYDAHLYVSNWGTHQVMLRLPCAFLSLPAAGQYCTDPHVAAWAYGEHLVLVRPLYLAWLAAFGTWERGEDAFGYDGEDELEPPVPAGLGALTAPQRAPAGFLRLDAGLRTIAARAGRPLAGTKDDPRKLARWIKDLPASDKDKLLHRVARGQGAKVQMELRRRFRGEPGVRAASLGALAAASLAGSLSRLSIRHPIFR